MPIQPKQTKEGKAQAQTQESLIEYPSIFPIKVMGKNVEGFLEAITHIAHSFDPSFDPSTIELRPSSSAHYLGITLNINATSREQLDELYRTLSTHPMVKVVL
jgi:putative lipoic acid-binding regulatory protein